MTLLTEIPTAEALAAKALRDPETLHRRLAHWNHKRMSAGLPAGAWMEDLREEHEMRVLEGAWVEAFRAEIAEEIDAVPTDVEGFIAWFEDLKASGPGQGDPLFQWLAEEATLEELRWFLTQEAAGEAGFDDLVALTQVKLPVPAKATPCSHGWPRTPRSIR